MNRLFRPSVGLASTDLISFSYVGTFFPCCDRTELASGRMIGRAAAKRTDRSRCVGRRKDDCLGRAGGRSSRLRSRLYVLQVDERKIWADVLEATCVCMGFSEQGDICGVGKVCNDCQTKLNIGIRFWLLATKWKPIYCYYVDKN